MFIDKTAYYERIARILDSNQVSYLDITKICDNPFDLMIVAKKAKQGDFDHLQLKRPGLLFNSCQVLFVENVPGCSDSHFCAILRDY